MSKQVYLKKDTDERFNRKRVWLVVAYRLVDADGKDQVQPWPRTKKDALEIAKMLGWEVLK